MSHERLKLFVSYASRDRDAVEQLIKQLDRLERSGSVELAYAALREGSEQHIPALERALSEASVVLFLVSTDWLRSGTCQKELDLALANADRKLLIPVILKPCEWFTSRVSRFTALPRDGKPVSQWDTQSQAYDEIADGLRAAIGAYHERLKHGSASAPSMSAGQGHPIRRVAITPDGRCAVVLDARGAAKLWDLTTRTLLRAYYEQGVVDVAVMHTQPAAVLLAMEREVQSLDAATGVQLAVVRLPAPAKRLAVAGEMITVWLDHAFFRVVYRRRAGERLEDVPGLNATIVDIAAASGVIACAFEDGTCEYFPLAPHERGNPLDQKINVAQSPLVVLRLFNDGVHGLTGSKSGQVHLIDGKRVLLSFEISRFPIEDLAPLSDGQHAVAACREGILLIDLRSGAVLQTLALPDDYPTALAITPDGRHAVWGSARGAVSLWPVDTTPARALPYGRDRLMLAYLAVLESPELWKLLETFDESALLGLAERLALAPGSDVLAHLQHKHKDVQPPPLWSAWIQQLHESKLGRSQGPR